MYTDNTQDTTKSPAHHLDRCLSNSITPHKCSQCFPDTSRSICVHNCPSQIVKKSPPMQCTHPSVPSVHMFWQHDLSSTICYRFLGRRFKSIHIREKKTGVTRCGKIQRFLVSHLGTWPGENVLRLCSNTFTHKSCILFKTIVISWWQHCTRHININWREI